MPSSFNGTGTSWYGSALPGKDGSVVVTEWITLLWMPLIPLGSKRVLFESDQTKWYTGHSLRYRVQPAPLYMPHLIKAYAVTIPIILFFCYCGMAAN